MPRDERLPTLTVVHVRAGDAKQRQCLIRRTPGGRHGGVPFGWGPVPGRARRRDRPVHEAAARFTRLMWLVGEVRSGGGRPGAVKTLDIERRAAGGDVVRVAPLVAGVAEPDPAGSHVSEVKADGGH